MRYKPNCLDKLKNRLYAVAYGHFYFRTLVLKMRRFAPTHFLRIAVNRLVVQKSGFNLGDQEINRV